MLMPVLEISTFDFANLCGLSETIDPETAKRRRAEAEKTKAKTDSIIRSLSKESKIELGASPRNRIHLTSKQGEWVVKRFLIQRQGEAIAFLDILSDDNLANITLAVREDQQGKGYGFMVAKKASKWIDDNIGMFDRFEWCCLETNEPSIKLAKQCGFKRYKSRDYETEAGKFLCFAKGKGI